MKIIRSDILVIGSGIAGLFFASQSAGTGSINVITKAAIDESNTRLAQGGIACVKNTLDDFESHIHDTLVAGAGHCNNEAVEIMVSKAPGLIDELVDLGVRFSKEKDSFNLSKEGGHSHHRILHAADITGSVIEHALVNDVKQKDTIRTYEYFIAIKLLVRDSCCYGAIALDIKNDEYVFFQSKATVLASGGGGQAFLRTTNPTIATGDGYALAAEVGVVMADMEFVQFHPTMLHHENANGFLISEALRGAGAELVLADGKPFMKDYHYLGSLAPRDIVSRAIYTEMKKFNLSHVFLDARMVPVNIIHEHFPNISRTCLELGFDLHHDLIPVSPAAHFICGGASTDLNGCTNIGQLYAIGEAARTGVHGANRLASNSLLEGLVFGQQAANHLAIHISGYHYPAQTFEFHSTKARKTELHIREIKSLKEDIQKTMWEQAGIVRNNFGMLEAKKKLHQIGLRMLQLHFETRLGLELIELKSLYITSALIINEALKRKISLGAHYLESLGSIPNNKGKTKQFFIQPNLINHES